MIKTKKRTLGPITATPQADLDAADANWIQFTAPGEYHSHKGALAANLIGAREFECTGFPFQVWEIVTHDHNGNPCAILRANQSKLTGALRYMNENRVLVYNQQADAERINQGFSDDNRDLFEPL